MGPLKNGDCIFTFHYASIKTLETIAKIYVPYKFTFHYASIKTNR